MTIRNSFFCYWESRARNHLLLPVEISLRNSRLSPLLTLHRNAWIKHNLTIEKIPIRSFFLLTSLSKWLFCKMQISLLIWSIGALNNLSIHENQFYRESSLVIKYGAKIVKSALVSSNIMVFVSTQIIICCCCWYFVLGMSYRACEFNTIPTYDSYYLASFTTILNMCFFFLWGDFPVSSMPVF